MGSSKKHKEKDKDREHKKKRKHRSRSRSKERKKHRHDRDRDYSDRERYRRDEEYPENDDSYPRELEDVDTRGSLKGILWLNFMVLVNFVEIQQVQAWPQIPQACLAQLTLGPVLILTILMPTYWYFLLISSVHSIAHRFPWYGGRRRGRIRWGRLSQHWRNKVSLNAYYLLNNPASYISNVCSKFVIVLFSRNTLWSYHLKIFIFSRIRAKLGLKPLDVGGEKKHTSM